MQTVTAMTKSSRVFPTSGAVSEKPGKFGILEVLRPQHPGTQAVMKSGRIFMGTRQAARIPLELGLFFGTSMLLLTILILVNWHFLMKKHFRRKILTSSISDSWEQS